MEKLKLIALIITMLVCGRVSSQIVTQKSHKVCIDTLIARKIAIDLIDGDICKKELELTKANIKLMNQKLDFKDSIIYQHEEEEYNLNMIISQKDDIIAKQEEISKTYKQDLNKQKRSSIFYKILSILGLGTTTYLLITK